MAKISVVVLADTETHGDLGRLANALATVKEVTLELAAIPLALVAGVFGVLSPCV